MKQLLLLFATLLLHINAHSCSCSFQSDARHFCEVVGNAQSKPMFCVVQAKVVSWYHWGMRAKVLGVIRGNPISDTITIWGDNGATCRPPVSAAFLLGDTIIACLVQTDFMGNSVSTSQPDYELATHYMLQGCGTHFLRYRNGVVTGTFDNNEQPDTIGYEDFTTRVHHCIAAAGIAHAKESPISIFPNPGTDVFWIDAPGIFANLQVHNSLGQCVLTKKLTGTPTNINLGPFAAGIYTVTLYATDKINISRHKIVRQ